MSENKTKPTRASITRFLQAVEPPGRRQDALLLHERFKKVTQLRARMWGASIVGYGSYDYTYESGRSGSFLATGFSPRKANMVLYIMPGYADFATLLGRLGPHKLGKSCLYLGRLTKIDLGVLDEIIVAGLKDLRTRWPVHS